MWNVHVVFFKFACLSPFIEPKKLPHPNPGHAPWIQQDQVQEEMLSLPAIPTPVLVVLSTWSHVGIRASVLLQLRIVGEFVFVNPFCALKPWCLKGR